MIPTQSMSNEIIHPTLQSIRSAIALEVSIACAISYAHTSLSAHISTMSSSFQNSSAFLIGRFAQLLGIFVGWRFKPQQGMNSCDSLGSQKRDRSVSLKPLGKAR
ncbi:unnamed protein product [Nezara viridula]|uniref:Uncharacterized protein n=1 Tax=Nezara viridula TaxID=85310 RepID=A0A9P0E2X1_NEZVI|nr:unnamed protein product [Nezara viridula]